MSEEYRIIQKGGFTIPKVGYILSRFVDPVKFDIFTLTTIVQDMHYGILHWSICFRMLVSFRNRHRVALRLRLLAEMISDCQKMIYANTTLWEIAMSSTSLLFLLRVRAVFSHSKAIKAFFGILWLIIVGCSVLLLLSVRSGEWLSYLSVSRI